MNRIIDYENLSKEIQNWIINYVNEFNIKTLYSDEDKFENNDDNQNPLRT
jgi:hypothetical protein